jgi:hypothetical protein
MRACEKAKDQARNGTFQCDVFYHGDIEAWRKRRKAKILGKHSYQNKLKKLFHHRVHRVSQGKSELGEGAIHIKTTSSVSRRGAGIAVKRNICLG